MARERYWDQFGPELLTSNGTTDGIIEVNDTCGAYVKQKILLKSNTQERADLEIKRVLSSTQIQLGPTGQNIDTFADLSGFLTTEAAFIIAKPQSINHVPPADMQQAMYAREPIVAQRSILVDPYGDFYKVDNPMPVQLSNGSIDIGTVNAELEVQLSRRDNNPDAGDVHDSVRLGNQDYELSYTANDDESKAAADVNALNRLIDVPHDDVEITDTNDCGDPTVIEFRENNNLKLTLNLTYNAEGDLQRVQRVKP